MSWQYEADFNIAPHQSFSAAEEWEFIGIAERKAMHEVNKAGSVSLTVRQTVQLAILASKVAALAIVKAYRTEYSTGCKVQIRCSGHIDDDVLNFGPSHTHVEVVVIPRPFTR